MSTAEPKIHTDFYEYHGYYDDYGNDSALIYLCENHEPNAFGATLTPVLFSLTFIISLAGNALVLWVLVRYERLKTVTDIFILNLVTSNLLFTFSLPFWAVDHTRGWIFGKVMCKIMSSIFFIGYYSGIMLLTLMTIDRYFIVVHPLPAVRIRKVSYAIAASSVVWGISMAATVPEMIFSDIVGHEENRLYCISDYPPESAQILELLGYYLQNILFFFIPFVVIVFCYWRILNTVIRCKAKKKHKTVKLILWIVVVFFVCWTPYNVVILLFSLVTLKVPAFETCEMNIHLTYMFYISRDLAYCHCCLNPFFYAFVGTKFRNHLTLILRKYFPQMGIHKPPRHRRRSHYLSSSTDYSNASSTFNTYL
ncbi:C-C chemokine receptor type 3-like [Chiloscyllium plagiosum]|uniref:C-C chemokine receptor type 3-like n=1 Tax=Chiloscyllium plagiosum TaxID=36176 RepID=UPI001CB7F360|nr:C-C chemokine receptor type 3-like [Chiloscyllium plagiosum]